MSLTKDDLVDITELMSTLLQQQERRLNKRFDEVLGVVGGEFVERSEQITDHERRITRLEHRAQSA